MRQLHVRAMPGYGRKRYDAANDLAFQIAKLIQRDSKYKVTFTESDITRLKELGYTIKIQSETL